MELSAAPTDLGALATKPSRAFGAGSCPFLELPFFLRLEP
jgi:hypothetical protein